MNNAFQSTQFTLVLSCVWSHLVNTHFSPSLVSLHKLSIFLHSQLSKIEHNLFFLKPLSSSPQSPFSLAMAFIEYVLELVITTNSLYLLLLLININQPHTITRNYHLNMLDTYLVHPSDNHGLAIVSPRLNNQIYNYFSRLIIMDMHSKKNQGSIEGDIAQGVIWMDIAHEVGVELQDHYNQEDVFQIVDLQEEIFSLKQGDQTITQFFTTLNNIS